MTLPRAGFKVKRYHETVALILIIAMALIYRLLPLNRGLGQDELFSTVQFIEVPSILRTIFNNIAFNNHIGYSVMARVSESLFGRSEWALRLPALVLGIATLYVLYLFSRPLLGRVPALLVTLLLALAPAHINWSVEARGYSAMIFFTLLSSYLFLKLLRQPNRRDAVLFIAASVLGIYVHLYAVFVTGIQILYALRLAVVRLDGRPSFVSINTASSRLLRNCFLIIAGLALILYVPVFWLMLRDLVDRGRSDFNPLFPWEVIQGLTGSNWFAIVIFVMLTAFGGWFSFHRSHPSEANYLAWLIAPLLLMWLVRPFDLYPRFFAYWLPYYLILFTAGIVWLANSMWQERRKIIGHATRLLSLLLLVAVLFNWTLEWQNAVPDEGYRAVSQAVVQGANPSAVYCAIGGARSVWQYYIHKPIVNPLTLAEVQELGRTHPEVRCVYYAAFWEDEEQTRIAQFLFQHASWSSINELTWFVYRSDESSSSLH